MIRRDDGDGRRVRLGLRPRRCSGINSSRIRDVITYKNVVFINLLDLFTGGGGAEEAEEG